MHVCASSVVWLLIPRLLSAGLCIISCASEHLPMFIALFVVQSKCYTHIIPMAIVAGVALLRLRTINVRQGRAIHVVVI